MTTILDAIDEALDRGDPVYVHCLGGVDRTCTAAGCWLVRHGLTRDEPLRWGKTWRRPGASPALLKPLSRGNMWAGGKTRHMKGKCHE